MLGTHSNPNGQRSGGKVRALVGALTAGLVAALTLVVPAVPASAGTYWSNPIPVASGETDAAALRVAASSDGLRVAAVWLKPTGLTTNDVRLARSANGGASWSAPVTLGSGDEPQIVVSDNGQKLTVAWAQFIDGDNLARTRSSSDGGATWTDAKSISLVDYRVGHLRLAASSDGGTASATWEDIQSGTTPGTQRIRVTTTTDGGATWSAPQEVTDISDYQGKNPAVAVSANGQVQTVVWMARGPDEFSVFAANSTNRGSTWTAKPIRVTASAGTPQADTVVESSADGKTVTAVWQTRVFGDLSIVAATSVDTGQTWRNWRLLGDGSGPSLAVDPSGANLTAVWTSTKDSSSIESGWSGNAGDTWPERSVLAPHETDSSQVALAESPDGIRVTAVWRDAAGLLFSAGSDDGGADWGPASQMTTVAGASIPAATGSSARNQVAVWVQGGDTIQAATGHFKSPQLITFAPPAANVQFSVGSVQLKATVSSGLDPAFRSDTPAVCTISGSKAVLVTAGRCAVTATSAATDDFEAATPVQRSFTVQRSNQTITFPAMPAVELDAGKVALPAVATSKLPIVYTSQTPSTCTIEGTNARLVDTGDCVVTATQPGSGGYLPAANVQQSFPVRRNGQKIDFGVIANKPLTVGALKLKAKSNSGLPIKFTSLTDKVCKANDDTLKLRKKGTCKVRADQAGNAEFAPAPPVTRSFKVVDGPGLPKNVRFSLRNAKSTIVTWAPGKRGATRYVVKVGKKVQCRSRKAGKCTLKSALGPRANVTVTAFADAASATADAKYRRTADWIAIGKVQFAADSAALNAKDKRLIAREAKMLASHGFSSVLVTGHTARSEGARLAAKRAKAAGNQLTVQLKKQRAKVKVSKAVRAHGQPRAHQAVLWVK